METSSTFARSRRVILATSAAVFAMASPQAASAQTKTPDSAETSAIGEIVVTAQKREERLQKVPISITAISADQLVKSGIQSTVDLPQLTSGLVTVAGNSGNTLQSPFIRGIGAASAVPGVDPSVATYVDGVYSASKFLNMMDLGNIERIEVLKGPQGTLYGRNASGGAINLITRKPSEVLSGSFSGTYGRFDETVQRGYLTGGLAPGLAASASIVARQGGDFVKNRANDTKFGGLTSVSANGQLFWQPTDNFNLRGSVTYQRRRSRQLDVQYSHIPGIVPIGGQFGADYSTDPDEANLNISPRINSKSTKAWLRATYSFDAVDLVSITSYEKGRVLFSLDPDGTTADILRYDIHGKAESIQQELQLVSTGNGPFQWILGGFFIKFDEAYSPLGVVAPPNLIEYYTYPKTRAGAAFAQGTYDVGGGTKITAGLRYSSDKKTHDARLLQNGTLVAGPSTEEKTFHRLTWRFSIDHAFTDKILGYVSYNRGFNSGAFDALTVAPQKPIAPEILDAFEAGIKSQFLGGRLQFNGAFYYYDYKNIHVQRVATGSSQIVVLEAAGAAKLYGFDADVVAVPFDGLRLNAGVNIEHSEYTKYDNASGFTLANGVGTSVSFPSLKGSQVLFTPNLTFNAGASYEHKMANGSALSLNANYAYNSSYKQVAGDNNFVKAYGILNGAITWTAPEKAYTVEVWGRNLTNVRDYGQYLTALGLTRQIMRPATYGVTLGVNF